MIDFKIVCKRCGKHVPVKCSFCPHCGESSSPGIPPVKGIRPTTAQKKKWILFLLTAVILVVAAYMLAQHGQPGFIRMINGPVFLFVWPCYMIVVLIISKIFSSRIFDNKMYSLTFAVADLSYTDEELMSLNSFSNYLRTGYYILKMKFDKIIEEYSETDEETGKRISCLRLIEGITAADVEKYIEKVPKVSGLLRSLLERAKLGDKAEPLSMCKAVYEFGISDSSNIFDSGSLAIYRESVAYVAHSVFLNKIIWWFVALYPGIVKLFLGLAREKEISYLVVMLLCIGFVCIISILYSFTDAIIDAEEFSNDQWRHAINVKNRISENMSNDDILKAYASKNIDAGAKYLKNIMFAVAHAEEIYSDEYTAMERMRIKASVQNGSGCFSCSSCSSCSSCGGGCGGCGDD